MIRELSEVTSMPIEHDTMKRQMQALSNGGVNDIPFLSILEVSDPQTEQTENVQVVELPSVRKIDFKTHVGERRLGERRELDYEPEANPPPLPPPLPPPPVVLPAFEIWGSDSSSFFGKRLRTVQEGIQGSEQQSFWIEPDDKGRDIAVRYVTLRIFEPFLKLRLDSFRVHGIDSRRRNLEEEREGEKRDEKKEKEDEHRRRLQEEVESKVEGKEREIEHLLHWWNRVDTHCGDEDYPRPLYPIRAPPDSEARSPFASLALSRALSNSSDSGIPNATEGHVFLLRSACEVFGCFFGSVPDLVFGMKEHKLLASWRDDVGVAFAASSLIIEPAVHVIVNSLLPCASNELCSSLSSGCSVCGYGRRGGERTAIEVVEEVEREVVGGGGKSRDPISCLLSPSCVSDVASSVAERLDVLSLPLNSESDSIIRSGSLFAEGMQTALVNLNSSSRGYVPLLEARRSLSLSHSSGPVSSLSRPVWATDYCNSQKDAGRRLQEEGKEISKKTIGDAALEVSTNATCKAIESGNLTDAVEKHSLAVKIWMRMRGGGNLPKGQGPCSDCSHPGKTVACRVHFATTGRRIRTLRNWQRQAPERELAEKKRTLKEAAEQHMERACCARFEDGRKECGEKYCEIHMRRSATKRIAQVSRRLHETNHSSASNLSVAARVGIDILHPEGHSDSKCRDGSGHNLSFAECTGRSLLHHIGKKHGLDAETTKRRMEEVGLDMGDSVKHLAKVMGVFGERGSFGGKGTAKTKDRKTRRAEDAKVAADMLRRARVRNRKEGRMMEEGEKQHTVGGKAQKRGEMDADRLNSTRRMERVAKEIEQAALRHNAEQMSSRRTSPHSLNVDNFYRDSLYTTARSISAGISSVQTEPGSIFSRFQGFLSHAASLKEKVHSLAVLSEKKMAERRKERERRLSSRPALANEMYDSLGKEVKKRVERRRRRLLEAGAAIPPSQTIHIPSDHALSWVHDVFDFRSTSEEMRRLADIEEKRQEMRRLSSVSESDVVRAHPTGYYRLDSDEYKTSAVGDALRRLHHRMEHGKDPDGHDPSLRRRIEKRMSRPGGERYDSRQRLRRLAEALYEGVSAAPFAFADTLLPSGDTIPQSKQTFWDATIQYLTYSTVGCYFMKPDDEVSETQSADASNPSMTEDGEELHVHRPRSEKLCFPAVYFVLPTIPKFRQMLGIDESLKFKDLTYVQYCASRGALQNTADALTQFGFNVTDQNPFTGQNLILRTAEAVDSVTHAVESGQAGNSYRAAGLLLCAVTEIGGIIYVLIVIVFVLVGLAFLPIFHFIVSFTYDLFFALSVRGIRASDTVTETVQETSAYRSASRSVSKVRETANQASRQIGAAKAAAAKSVEKARRVAQQARDESKKYLPPSRQSRTRISQEEEVPARRGKARRIFAGAAEGLAKAALSTLDSIANVATVSNFRNPFRIRVPGRSYSPDSERRPLNQNV